MKKRREEVRVGFHYTSLENWEKIQRDGRMIPYEIKNLREVIGYVKGIWVFTERHVGFEHLGNLIYQACMKSTTCVVLLCLTFWDSDRYKVGGRDINVTHDGSLNGLTYHKDKQAVILKDEVPLDRITLIHEYDLNELTEAYERSRREDRDLHHLPV